MAMVGCELVIVYAVHNIDGVASTETTDDRASAEMMSFWTTDMCSFITMAKSYTGYEQASHMAADIHSAAAGEQSTNVSKTSNPFSIVSVHKSSEFCASITRRTVFGGTMIRSWDLDCCLGAVGGVSEISERNG